MKDLPEVEFIRDYHNGRRFYRKGQRIRPVATLRQMLEKRGMVVVVKKPAAAVVKPPVVLPDPQAVADEAVERLSPDIVLPRRSKRVK